jgi:site-specific recombinase XerD
LAELRKERAAAVLNGTHAASTLRAYATDWAQFAAWCEQCGRSSLPASSDSVQLYLVDLARRGRAPATLERRVVAITRNHRQAGHRSPVDVDVREVLLGLRRRLGAAPRNAKAALTIPDLRRMLAAIAGDDARAVRDRALLLVGFASGLRRSELAALRLADCSFEALGVVFHLGRSKTDQEGIGRAVGMHKGRNGLCPVLALEAWIQERGAWPGALFCVIDNCGRLQHEHMAPECIGDLVQAVAARAGLEASRYGAHSLRAGLVTAAGSNGVGTLAIMARTGHKDVKTLGRYMRPANALLVDPLAGLL